MPKASDFWSRRRRAVAAEEDDRARIEDEAEREATEAELETADDETLLQMLGLPDPETLTPADAARFMAREVPGRLRKRALRVLFRSHPGLSLPDGLNDYDGDYVNAPLAPSDRSGMPCAASPRPFQPTSRPPPRRWKRHQPKRCPRSRQRRTMCPRWTRCSPCGPGA